MKKNFIATLLLFTLLFSINAEQKIVGKITLNKAVDNRKIKYDEKTLFKEYGYFTKDCLIGGGYELFSIDVVNKNPFITDKPIDISITEAVYEALKFSNFEVNKSTINNNSIILDIEIKKLFMNISESSSLGLTNGSGTVLRMPHTTVSYKPEMEIKLYLKNMDKNVFLEKTFCFYDIITNRSYSSPQSIINYFSNKLIDQLMIFFQNEIFLEAYNGRKKEYKEYIKTITLENLDDFIDFEKEISLIPIDINNIYLAGRIIDDTSFVNNFSDLIELNISNNQLLSKLSDMDNLKNLEVLFLGRGQFLKDISKIKSLVNLKYLDLSNNLKIKAYKSITELKNLKFLSLENNNLKKIENLNNLSNLIILELGLNKLNKIENLDNNNNLIFLDIGVNNIIKIENLEKLSNLEKLDLSYNKIDKIENIQNLTNLKILELNGNPISKIENLNKFVNLKKLYLWGTNIKKIENLEDLRNLEYLSLGYNKNIDKLENLDNLLNLKVLNLSGTSIKDIENINHLINLEELYLGETKISQLNNIENLKKLKILDISKTKIKNLKLIENFPELTTLDITKSKIEKLESIEKCPYLRSIKAKDMQIDYISRASYEHMKKRKLIFFKNLTIDEYIKKFFIKIVD